MPQGVPFVDTGNQLLGPVPASLDAGTVTQPDGTKLVVITLRTASTTMTVMLTAGDFATWMKVLDGLRDTVGARIQVVTADQARQMGLNGGGPARPPGG